MIKHTPGPWHFTYLPAGAVGVTAEKRGLILNVSDAGSRIRNGMADFEAEDPIDREHVTSYLWRQPSRFHCATYPCPMDLTPYQTSIDTPQDLLLAQGILSWCLDRYGFTFTWRAIWWCLEMNPHLKQLMLQRPPRNQSYVTQIGGSSWEALRYNH